MKTTRTPKAGEIKREWHIIDAKDQVLGRLSTTVAQKLIGKHKTNFVPNLDCGDYVVVINAQDVKVTGKKATDKVYYRHSNYPGGLKSIAFRDLLAKDPRKVIELAVRGMIGKNKLQDKRLRRLKVFAGETHPYSDKLNKQD